MIQTTLDGLPAGYTCRQCGRCYPDMSSIVRHVKRIHKKKPVKETHQNFVLWNYKMVSSKVIVGVEN